MIGNRLKSLRESMGLKQEDVAKAISVSPSTIGMYEINKREPNNEIIIKLAQFFNVTTDYLLGNSNIRNPEELKKVQFANSGRLDVNGLDDEDLLELQKQVDYIKKLKGKN